MNHNLKKCQPGWIMPGLTCLDIGYVSYSRALIDSQVLRAKPGALAMPKFVTVIITVISIVTDL